jgi:hypothetical protein
VYNPLECYNFFTGSILWVVFVLASECILRWRGNETRYMYIELGCWSMLA